MARVTPFSSFDHNWRGECANTPVSLRSARHPLLLFHLTQAVRTESGSSHSFPVWVGFLLLYFTAPAWKDYSLCSLWTKHTVIMQWTGFICCTPHFNYEGKTNSKKMAHPEKPIAPAQWGVKVRRSQASLQNGTKGEIYTLSASYIKRNGVFTSLNKHYNNKM